tara:strand:- start:382 stop:909 length:528 start_codon:yes stop_codon:yes gene_type:complete
MATVNTTFTFSSTDISSDALSFSVSETLALTGSGGIQRANLTSATGSASAFELYNSESFGDNLESGVTSPTYLYLKNITGSGFSASADSVTTSSHIHLYVSGTVADAANNPIPKLEGTGAYPGVFPIASIRQGGFTYVPINPRLSYYVWAADATGSEGQIGGHPTETIIEFGVFN